MTVHDTGFDTSTRRWRDGRPPDGHRELLGQRRHRDVQSARLHAHAGRCGCGQHLHRDVHADELGTGNHTLKATYAGDTPRSSSPAASAPTHLTVVSANQAPTATAQSVTTNEDTAKTITLNGTDPNGNALTFSIVSPSNGRTAP